LLKNLQLLGPELYPEASPGDARRLRAARIYRERFRATETVRAAIFAADANCSGVACRSALSSSLSMAML